MPCEISITVRLLDPELLDASVAQYVALCERGEMTPEEAESNLEALVMGMVTFE